MSRRAPVFPVLALAATLAAGCDPVATNATRPAPTSPPAPPPAPPPPPPPPPATEPPPVSGTPVAMIPGHETLAQDTTRKEGPRLMPAETYIRSYLALFGGLAPQAVVTRARGADGAALFDVWNDYLASLGLPDYRFDLPRNDQTNALMMATFERLAVALCDRAVEADLRGTAPLAQRVVFAFDGTPAGLDLAGFTARFDVLHRTFLGYPARLATTDRVSRFFALYQQTVGRHAAPGAAASRFTPEQAGWATVCYGLARHPEFHAY